MKSDVRLEMTHSYFSLQVQQNRMNEIVCNEICSEPLVCKHFTKVGIDSFVCTQVVDGLLVWDILVKVLAGGCIAAGIVCILILWKFVRACICRKSK